MDTYIAYFDEAGDDGVTTSSSEFFVLTSLYMSTENWQSNFNSIRDCRRGLKDRFGLHISEEFHTKHLLSDKDPYRKYGWTPEQRQDIVKEMVVGISDLEAQAINVIIDKTHFKDQNYKVLENALTYNIQRIDNDSRGLWNFLIITDQGRVAPMRKTARAIRAYNPIPSRYSQEPINQPINNMIEDILEKDSQESYFIQACDLISYIVHLYYKCHIKKQALPNRVGRTIDEEFVCRSMATMRDRKLLNLKANSQNPYGLVIYPK